MEHLEHREWSTFVRDKRWTMIHIIDVIHRAYAMLDNWFCFQHQIEDHAEDRAFESSSQIRDFPHFLTGCQGRLRLHMEQLTPYRKVMLYILRICRENQYRRHGASLFPPPLLLFSSTQYIILPSILCALTSSPPLPHPLNRYAVVSAKIDPDVLLAALSGHRRVVLPELWRSGVLPRQAQCGRPKYAPCVPAFLRHAPRQANLHVCVGTLEGEL